MYSKLYSLHVALGRKYLCEDLRPLIGFLHKSYRTESLCTTIMNISKSGSTTSSYLNLLERGLHELLFFEKEIKTKLETRTFGKEVVAYIKQKRIHGI